MHTCVCVCMHSCVCVWECECSFYDCLLTKEVDDNCCQEKLCELQDEVVKTNPKVCRV